MGVQHGPQLLGVSEVTWRLFLAQIAGAFLIIGVAYGFLVSEPLLGRAEAAGALDVLPNLPAPNFKDGTLRDTVCAG